MKYSVLTVALTLLAAIGHAENASIALSAGKPAELIIESALDDRNFQDPRGYNRHGAATHVFARRLTLINTGPTPLTGRLLITNGHDWSHPDTLAAHFGPTREPSLLMPRLFGFWCDQISHADSAAPGGKEPLAMLNFWSYALCGDNTSALTRLATALGIPARKIPLNGHVAAEYFYDHAWHILDADQNVSYLRLDNRTLASAADLRTDPFLARRTKVFGRHAAMGPANSAFNTSLHEFIDPKDEKPVSQKAPPAPVRDETLFPGEKMIVHRQEAPNQPVGQTDLSRWGTVRDDALCVVEYVIHPRTRSATAAGEIEFASGYPILSALNHTTGEVFAGPAGQPTFAVKVRFAAPDDSISIYCQRTKASAPSVQKGRNTFLLSATDPKGAASLDVEWEPAPPDVTAPAVSATLADTTPAFSIRAQPDVDQIWWQISTTSSFDFVPPNFDTVAPSRDTLTFDPFTATFFNPNQPYFLRIKGRRGGVWGEWSAPLEFRVEKPARPAPLQVDAMENGLLLKWPHAGEGCEYLVFGSNRLDFVPEPFAAEEIVAMRDAGIEKSRPNTNLVGVVTKPEIKLEPNFHFYRVITRRAGILSVPGDLITTPPEFAAKLPPALVLQDRWRRIGATDEHLATEMPLRPKAPK